MISNEKLPENFEIEKIILGSAINSELAKNKILLSLTAEDFFTFKNRVIFEIIYDLNNKNKDISFYNLVVELKNQKKFNENGIDIIYLKELTKSVILLNKIDEYISIIKETTILRKLLIILNTIEANYLNKNYKIESYNFFITEIQRSINNILEQRKISTFVDSKQIVKETKCYIEKLITNEKILTGFDTGFHGLNKCTNGLQKQNLIVVAGRTGVGKTTLALNIALNVAIKDEVPIAIFSMEMSSIQLFIRLVSISSNIESRKILEGKLERNEQLAVYETLKKLEKIKIFVDESSSLTILDLITKIKILKNEQPKLGLVIIDYLGLISKEKNKKIESRHLEIQEYTRKFHELARELDLSIVLLCQLNRKIDDRTNGQPKLSDLRESGSIEQDAELVFLIYEPNEINNNENNGYSTNEKKINIKIAKNRNGVSGIDVNFIFKKKYSKFAELMTNSED